MASTPIAITCCIDDHFAMPLTVLLYSAASGLAHDHSITAYVIDAGVTDASKRRIDRSLHASVPGRVTLKWLRVDTARFAGLPTAGFHRSILYRLDAPAMLPHDLRRTIYLDADMVVRADLSRLWHADLAGRVAWAVRDFGTPTVGSPQGIPTTFREYGLTAEMPYFNSGLIMFDPARWRDLDVGGRAVAYLAKHADVIRWPDQDALNAALRGDWGQLDPRWNSQIATLRAHRRRPTAIPVTVGEDQIDQLLHDPFVIHYSSGKPWETGLASPARRAWFRALRESAWLGPVAYQRFVAASLLRSVGKYARTRMTRAARAR